jgi:hypothetical protein
MGVFCWIEIGTKGVLFSNCLRYRFTKKVKMKISVSSKLLMMVVFVTTTMNMMATVWTVSNDPNRPAQYSVLQAAVDAAAPNDTLLVTGSTTQYYPGATIVKPLVIFGEGIEAGGTFPQTDIYGLNLGRFNSSLSASGTRVYGCKVYSLSINSSFSGSSPSQQTMSNIIFERCKVNYSYIYANWNMSNLTFRNCLFSEYGGSNLYFMGSNSVGSCDPILGPYSNVIVTNCVFTGNYSGISGSGGLDMNGNLVVRNCLFLNNSYYSLYQLQEGVFENNIWYKAELLNSSNPYVTNCTFNNNLTYLCNVNTLPPANSIGSGNIVNQNPLFTTYPALGAEFAWAHNYALQLGSPALGTGTNGTDIGINSGNSPVSQLYKYAKIPAVTALTIPVSSVPVGGTLQINIQAVSRD